MSKTILDGARMGSRAELHDALAAAFSLPAHYGRNLDALWDCLTEQREGTEVILTSPEAMPEALFAPLAALFLDLARTAAAGAFRLNPRLHSRGATATLKAENMSAWGLRSIPKRLPPWWFTARFTEAAACGCAPPQCGQSRLTRRKGRGRVFCA